MEKILFLTGTRADYGKIKSLMKKVDDNVKFELNIFVTGMHMLSKYGLTWKELEKDGFRNLYKFINQQLNSSMDIALSNTILGLSNYVHEMKSNLIVVHGDRLEALAGAIVGAFNNIKVAHIEGGEVSGTIDESIRHSITKLSHIHFVSNEEAKKRVIQLGEAEENIFIIGSPDIDIMTSRNLPTLQQAKERYDITFEEYSLVMYHPVTTEVEKLNLHVKHFVDALIASERNYIVIYPNNDEGTDTILTEYKRFEGNSHFKIFPSIRFEYFLTLMQSTKFMIGNSSAGIRETCVYGIPSIDIGNRQKNRYNLRNAKSIIHVNEDKQEILNAIHSCNELDITPLSMYGNGRSDEKFIEILEGDRIWNLEIQKRFNDIE
ncbi:UDP-N-acetylglucosamine 2-epimerase [Mesobacillus stamsii]|uniref:UDP-N-acetylglucosamine 2-epimerase (Hydrolyzing) n=1 Tax=Mesobacillus stamsii TaxID=225347 RepID=A0ABU0G0E1_9BACI|nr:UDP-N-acetylglucosamine 2-epimerase [Mesobacillus stamsii]MDQ0415656.1 UDP-N-acetylglucosamine 2-epimerase (hydrolyzing) [Mesobacillus stamsii]